ncbi:MATA-HMG [Gigaspora margarita]|uniref:MATA-HMG n=1 Tax=Gigaspora margarita TaxID=4874 RepID=A0A8H4ABL2_GIGMA|nr:MATA-HMG [Gigaspora margarita]
MASVNREQGLSIDSSPEGNYCKDCADKARSNGDNRIENPETFDYIKSSTEPPIKLKLPFPPTIKPEELVTNILKSKSQSPKMLNEFFIYRKVFVQELRKQNLKLKMTSASRMASDSWHKASSNIKNEYRRLAREVEKLYIKIRNEKLYDDQRKHVTNPAPVNYTPAISDVINNGNNIPSSPCALEQTINENPYSHINVPCSSILTLNSIDSCIPYYDTVYMAGYDNNMYLADFSNALPPFQSFQSTELFPTYSLSYMTNENLSDNINTNTYFNVTDFTPQTVSVEDSLANQNYFDNISFYYPTNYYEMI